MAERTVLVRLNAKVSDFVKGMGTAQAAVKGLTKEIDTSNDRTAWLAQSILALGPTLAPLGAAGIPIVTGLAAQMTVAATAAGTAALAFSGMGDALESVNDYQLEPTSENLAKMQIAMQKLGPDGAKFVRFLDDAGDKLSVLKMDARAGMLPGLEEGIDDLLVRLPQFRKIISSTAEAMGELGASAGKALGGERFDAFFKYLKNEAKPLLLDMGHTFGFFAEGLANMLVGFAPLSDDFSNGLAGMAESFAEWSRTLEDNESFQALIDYVQESAPKALDLLGSIIDAFVQLVEAAAPVGDVMVPILSAFFDIIALIADTPLGPILIGMAAATSIYGRAAALATITTKGLGTAISKNLLPGLGKVQAGFGGAVPGISNFTRAIGPAAAGAGLFALSMSDVDEKMGLSNTTMGAMAGLMVGGPWGAALGAGAGLLLDAGAANDDLKDATLAATEAIESQNRALMEQSRSELITQLVDAQSMDNPIDALGRLADLDWGRPLDAGPSIGSVNDGLFTFSESGTEAERVLAVLNEELGLAPDNTDKVTTSYDKATTAAENFARSVSEVNDALSGRATMRDYEQALDDFTARATKRAEILGELSEAQADLRDADTKAERESALERIASLREQAAELENSLDVGTQAGRDTEAALDAIAQNANDVAETLTGLDRKKFLKSAREAFIDAAEQAGLSEKAAKDLADELIATGRVHAKPKITVDADGAISIIGSVKAGIAGIHSKTVTIRAVGTGLGPQEDYATGGWTGSGGKYEPAGIVHRGEFVVPAPYAAQDRAMLESRYLPGYAKGGYVERATPASAAVQIDYRELAAALSVMRPMYGDVHVTDGYGDFHRRMVQDNRQAAGGGVARKRGRS
jgi:hypothetical protein